MLKSSKYGVFTEYEADFNQILSCSDFIGSPYNNVTQQSKIVDIFMIKYCPGWVSEEIVEQKSLLHCLSPL